MQEGDVIAGRFRLEARAGAGAMGIVFRACDMDHGATVAIKTWQGAGLTVENRFLREAAALAGLSHPALVRHIQHGISERGEAYLAMEWIEGPTLAQRVATRGVTPLEALLLAERLAAGLAALHAHGIVHRDLKPSNLMLPHDDVRDVRILDLGVARYADASTDLTVQGSHVGTPRYMAPEQIRDPRNVDGRADVFALGCVLFECLTGVVAFPGDDPVSVLAQILFGRAPDPSELRSDLPEELDELSARLLARSPELRPNPASELPELFAQLRLTAAARLTHLPALASLPPRSARWMSREASVTLLEASAARPSSPRLLTRRERPLQSILAEPPRDPLIGRERELSELVNWLVEGGPIILWGAAGVGKTRLALELVQLTAARKLFSPQALLFCDLTSARDSRDVTRITAQAIGISLTGQVDSEDFLGRMLGKFGPLLLILDRAEHLVREIEPLIQLWLRHAPDLRLLVTSRTRLPSSRELAVRPLSTRARSLRPAAGSSPGSQSPTMPPSAAAQLVLSLAARSLGSAAPSHDARDIGQAEHIAAALDGNPLAIALALARLPLLGFAGILERLPAQLKLLGPARESASMRDAFSWSWNLLSADERLALMQCACFQGPFALRAAEAVIALEPGAQPLLDVIQSLLEQSLLSSRLEGVTGSEVRLSMPAALREFAQSELEAAAVHQPEISDVRERHAAYCASFVDAPAGSAGQPDPEDCSAAVEFSLREPGSNPTRALRLIALLEPQLLAAGMGSRLADLLEQALHATRGFAETSDVTLANAMARARQVRARLLTPAGQFERARQDLAMVLAEAERLGDVRLHGNALLDMGVLEHFRREMILAREYYARALDRLAETDDAVAEARCYGNLGAVDHDAARLIDAAEGYRRAIALLPEQGQERLLANFQGNLALVEHELGREDVARDLYQCAIEKLDLLLDARLLGIVLGNFGTLELSSGRLAAALACFARAHALLEQSGDRRSEGLSLARYSAALAIDDRISDAEQRAARAERLLRKDPLARSVLELLGAFIDLAVAKQAASRVQLADADAALQRARSKRDNARAAVLNDRPEVAQSDDLRLYLNILEPRLDELAASLSRAT
jgi:serine/threonine protein kinase